MNTTTSCHIPARQEAGTRRPDVVPSFWGSFGKTRIFSYGEQPVTITSCSLCSSRHGWHVESHRHHPSVFADRLVCRYCHVICGAASKSRESRNCMTRRTARDGQ